MKIKQAHYNDLKSLITDYTNRLPAPLVDIHKDYLSEGLTDKRFRWDVLYASKAMSIAPPSRGFGSDTLGKILYQYLNDTHIDTALRSIMKELGVLS